MPESNVSGSLPLRLAPLLIGLVAVAGYMVYGCQEGPFGRKRVITLSEKDEEQLGAQAFKEVLQKEVVIDGGPAVDRVEEIGRNLARAAEDPELLKLINLKPRKFDWQFRVVRSKQVNAFCLPGGKVVVYTGILPVCETDAGLATVMGHEIGHALARHGAERMAQQQMVGIGQQAAAATLGGSDPQTQQKIMAVLGAGSNVGTLLPFSRSHESEADHIGILLMARAGYDPREAVKFWQRMEKATGAGKSPEFMSTHPSHDRRIHDLREKWLPDAMRIYEDSRPHRESLQLPGVRGAEE